MVGGGRGEVDVRVLVKSVVLVMGVGAGKGLQYVTHDLKKIELVIHKSMISVKSWAIVTRDPLILKTVINCVSDKDRKFNIIAKFILISMESLNSYGDVNDYILQVLRNTWILSNTPRWHRLMKALSTSLDIKRTIL